MLLNFPQMGLTWNTHTECVCDTYALKRTTNQSHENKRISVERVMIFLLRAHLLIFHIVDQSIAKWKLFVSKLYQRTRMYYDA